MMGGGAAAIGSGIMEREQSWPEFGWRAYGVGVLMLGATALAIGDFLPGQAVPKDLPGRTVLAYATAVFILACGAGLEWRRTAAWAAAAITAYYGLVVVLLMDARVVIAHWKLYLVYSNVAEEVAVAAGGLIVFAGFAPLEPALARRLTRIGQLAFGVCAVLFGGAHFAYMEMTAPLVPKWLPPSQLFWGYATGVFHIAGGLAILTGVRDRLAAILLTLMYLAFTPLVHIPAILADPSKTGSWIENATNLALAGAAWVVADSLRGPRATSAAARPVAA